MSTSPTCDGNIRSILMRLASVMFCDFFRLGVELLAKGDGTMPTDGAWPALAGGPSAEDRVMEFPPIEWNELLETSQAGRGRDGSRGVATR